MAVKWVESINTLKNEDNGKINVSADRCLKFQAGALSQGGRNFILPTKGGKPGRNFILNTNSSAEENNKIIGGNNYMKNEGVLAIPRGTQTISSVEVAKWVDKSHFNLLRDIDGYIENLSELAKLKNELCDEINILDYFIEGTYQNESSRKYRYFEITRKGCEFIANKLTGIKGTQFTATYIEVFHKMEEALIDKKYEMSPQIETEAELLARAFIVAQKTLEEKDRLIAEKDSIIKKQEPEVRFANAVMGTESNVLVGTFAKTLCQNGIDTGERRLYAWLRDNGYLIIRKGWGYNLPKQEYIDRGYFYIRQTVNNGFTNSTTTITPKGQKYFINKFLGRGKGFCANEEE